MSDDIRIDPLTGTPAIIVPSREGRPNLPDAGCPFCVGGLEAPEPYDVLAFPNRWPSLGEGRAEVVLFSPDHHASLATLSTEQLRRVVDLWIERSRVLGERDDVAYVLIFENRGAEVGATIPHPHGQIYAYGSLPPTPARELEIARHAQCCALCDETPGARLVAATPGWRAWIPAASGHPYGLVIAPTSHLGALGDLSARDCDALAELLGTVFRGLDSLFDEETPYVWWLHQRPTDANDHPWAHLHFEVVPHRRAPGVSRFVAAAELGSGTLINSIDPHEAARTLRLACTTGGTP